MRDEIRRILRARFDDPRRADYYADVASFCSRAIGGGGGGVGAGAAPIVGVSGPQGCGKSTLAASVALVLGDLGKRVVAISIDDFYLTHAEQRALAERYPGNPCLEVRGYPGTHDVALGSRVLDSVRSGAPTSIPAYDKSAHGGRGDRAPRAACRHVEGVVDLVIFEGWMLGFTPAPREAAPGVMAAPNDWLDRYREWNDRVDAFVWLEAEAPSHIVEWRVDSERARRARGETALSEEDARDYILRFLPAYELYVPRLAAYAPGRATLHVVLGADRLPAP
jgi:D-glycerate 3-kinase